MTQTVETHPNDPVDKRAHIIQAVAGHLVREGFGNSGIRALASSAGLSDRMLMYYFETKDSLITSALRLLADTMAQGLEALLPPTPMAPEAIVRTLIESARMPGQTAVLQLWFEIVGLAVRGQEPYRSTVSDILAAWEAWLTLRLAPEDQHRTRAVLAEVEGALMLELVRAPVRP
jgi:AcrR family transcriptional regulator